MTAKTATKQEQTPTEQWRERSKARIAENAAKVAQRTPDETLSLGILDEWSVDVTGPRAGLDEVLRRWRAHTELLAFAKAFVKSWADAGPTDSPLEAQARAAIKRAEE